MLKWILNVNKVLVFTLCLAGVAQAEETHTTGASPAQSASQSAGREVQKFPEYDTLIKKFGNWSETAPGGKNKEDIKEDTVKIQPSKETLEKSVEALKKIKDYREKISATCEATDPSAKILGQKIDECIAPGLFSNSAKDAKKIDPAYEISISISKLHACRTTFDKYYKAKQALVPQTDRKNYVTDWNMGQTLNDFFNLYVGVTVAPKTEVNVNVMIEALHKVSYVNLCQINKVEVIVKENPVPVKTQPYTPPAQNPCGSGNCNYGNNGQYTPDPKNYKFDPNQYKFDPTKYDPKRVQYDPNQGGGNYIPPMPIPNYNNNRPPPAAAPVQQPLPPPVAGGGAGAGGPMPYPPPPPRPVQPYPPMMPPPMPPPAPITPYLGGAGGVGVEVDVTVTRVTTPSRSSVPTPYPGLLGMGVGTCQPNLYGIPCPKPMPLGVPGMYPPGQPMPRPGYPMPYPGYPMGMPQPYPINGYPSVNYPGQPMPGIPLSSVSTPIPPVTAPNTQTTNVSVDRYRVPRGAR